MGRITDIINEKISFGLWDKLLIYWVELPRLLSRKSRLNGWNPIHLLGRILEIISEEYLLRKTLSGINLTKNLGHFEFRTYFTGLVGLILIIGKGKCFYQGE